MRIRGLLIAITAGLVAALVVGDRITTSVLDSLLADRFCAGAEVHVGGFPVLTQLAAGTLDDVTVDTEHAGIHVRVSLSDVSTRDRSVGAVRMAATVPWPAIAERMGTGVRLEPEGSRIAITPGRGVDTVLARVRVSGGDIVVEPDAVSMFGQEVPLDALGGAVDLGDIAQRVVVPLPALPYGVHATGAEVTDAGLAVHAEGNGAAGESGCGHEWKDV
jgi:hypothetical protein